MVADLEQMFRFIIFLLLYTRSTGQSVPENDQTNFFDSGRFQAKVINKEFSAEYLYKFAFEKQMFGSDAKKETVRELYYQETNCKKADVSQLNDTKDCNFNPFGKVMICQYKTTIVDLQNCKTTGDVYEIPPQDRRSEDYAMEAAKAYNKKNYEPDSNFKISLDVAVMSPLRREVSIGTRNSIKFATKEYNCTKISDPKGKGDKEMCTTIKQRLDCEATVTDPMFSISDIDSKVLVDVNCKESKDHYAILMKKQESREKTACRVIHYNPTTLASRSTTTCTKSQAGDDEKIEVPPMKTISDVDQIKIAPSKAKPVSLQYNVKPKKVKNPTTMSTNNDNKLKKTRKAKARGQNKARQISKAYAFQASKAETDKKKLTTMSVDDPLVTQKNKNKHKSKAQKSGNKVETMLVETVDKPANSGKPKTKDQKQRVQVKPMSALGNSEESGHKSKKNGKAKAQKANKKVETMSAVDKSDDSTQKSKSKPKANAHNNKDVVKTMSAGHSTPKSQNKQKGKPKTAAMLANNQNLKASKSQQKEKTQPEEASEKNTGLPENEVHDTEQEKNNKDIPESGAAELKESKEIHENEVPDSKNQQISKPKDKSSNNEVRDETENDRQHPKSETAERKENNEQSSDSKTEVTKELETQNQQQTQDVKSNQKNKKTKKRKQVTTKKPKRKKELYNPSASKRKNTGNIDNPHGNKTEPKRRKLLSTLRKSDGKRKNSTAEAATPSEQNEKGPADPKQATESKTENIKRKVATMNAEDENEHSEDTEESPSKDAVIPENLKTPSKSKDAGEMGQKGKIKSVMKSSSSSSNKKSKKSSSKSRISNFSKTSKTSKSSPDDDTN